MQRRHFLQASAAASLCGLSSAWAAWPDKPVKWILSQPPGSGPDNVARILADALAKNWGQSVVIDNRPGGQNTIGAQAAARSPADGYSFYFATTAALITNPLLFKQLPYDTAKDFVPVAFIASRLRQSPLRLPPIVIARLSAVEGGILSNGPNTRSMSARS